MGACRGTKVHPCTQAVSRTRRRRRSHRQPFPLRTFAEATGGAACGTLDGLPPNLVSHQPCETGRSTQGSPPRRQPPKEPDPPCAVPPPLAAPSLILFALRIKGSVGRHPTDDLALGRSTLARRSGKATRGWVRRLTAPTMSLAIVALDLLLGPQGAVQHPPGSA